MTSPKIHMATAGARAAQPHSPAYTSAMEKLVQVVQDLSHARDIETITQIVRDAARNLTGADGATFVLRDGDQCFYAEENAIGPLWKGRRFPMTRCISGWVMLNAKAATIEDIYSDQRIPADAYRPTFVKSLAMVPIRRKAPIGAIGNYWATNHVPTQEEMALLQALADTTSVALENVELYNKLVLKIGELEQSNYDLSCFAWAASHDLQEPLRTIITQIEMLDRHVRGSLGERDRKYIDMALEGAGRLQHLVQNLLTHAHAEKNESFQPVDLADIVEHVKDDLQVMMAESGAQIHAEKLPVVHGDPHLLECLFQNLLSNAIKFRSNEERPQIHITSYEADDEWIVSVSDNGLGIDSAYHQQIFGLFQRLNAPDKYPGSGIGLATCRKIVEAHGGRIWVESSPGKGSSFWFTLPEKKG